MDYKTNLALYPSQFVQSGKLVRQDEHTNPKIISNNIYKDHNKMLIEDKKFKKYKKLRDSKIQALTDNMERRRMSLDEAAVAEMQAGKS